MPAGQAERAAQLFAELRAWKEDSEKRGIPEIIAEIHRDRLWLALHYDTWEAACDALLGGFRVQLPRDDRREITAELHHEQGMSTRAIGTALGVSHTTVKRDLAGGTNVPPEPTPVTGLDGKTYTPKARVIHMPVDPVPDHEVEEVRARLAEHRQELDDRVLTVKWNTDFSAAVATLQHIGRHFDRADFVATWEPGVRDFTTQDLIDAANELMQIAAIWEDQ